MDPLSLAASLIAVVQVAQVVLLFCYQIRGQIKDADNEISRIIIEVEALAVILDELDDILSPSSDTPYPDKLLENLSLDEGGRTKRASISTACISAVRACETVLNELQQKLRPLAKPGIKNKLKWPFDSSSIQRKLDIVEKQKATLQLALSTYHARMLGQQSHKIEDIQKQSNRAAILTWYKTSDPEQNHKVSRSKHEPDTAKWIFDTEDFKNWNDKPGETLWVHGIPGAGKTILCSTIIDHMSKKYERDPSNRVAYFYFDFADNKKQTVGNLLKSVVYQLVALEDVIPDPAASLYTKCNGLQQPDLDELVGVFMTEISRKGRTFLMIDALDECLTEERKLFFETFVQVSLPNNLNVLITSRNEPDIAAALGPSFARTICIQNAVINADVRIHVGKATERDAMFLRWKPSIREEILNAIVEGTHGMFRWAVCQLDVMKKCLTPAMVRTELKRMPETLDQTYDRILRSVPSLHQSFVRSALHWLAFAARPLLLEELAEAAVLSPENGGFEPDVCRLLDENLILELCGTLVTASVVDYYVGADDWLGKKLSIHGGGYYSPYLNNNKFSVVSLSHYSVKEYIASQRLQKSVLSSFYTSEKLASTRLAECCLFYLLEYNQGEIASEIDFKEWPLLEYSACNWMFHWKNISADEQSVLRHLLERVFDPSSSNAYVNWLNVWNPETLLESTGSHLFHHREIKTSAEFYPPMLYWAASLGDLVLAQSLVGNGADITKRGGKFESPLGAAAYHSHSDIVGYFLEQKADPNLPSGAFGSVLQIAAIGGSVQVVKQLIHAGADVNAQGGDHNTALVAAASRFHIDVVKLLVQHGADLNISSQSYGSSLHQAAAASDTNMVITLLSAGADINEIGGSEGTPLYAAAKCGSLSLVQLLLRRGAKVNIGAPDSEYGYPVSIGAKMGHSQVVRALIRAGADVNISIGRRGVSTLEAAVEGRDMSTFLVVLDAGADTNVLGRLYMNCFHAAIWTGELSMARVLLERGAEFEDEGFLEAVSRYERNPWFLDKMLEQTPNCDAYRDEDGSALHVAIDKYNDEAARLILDQHPFIDTVSKNGSPLGFAIQRHMISLAKELIRQGADVNRKVQDDSPFGLAIDHICNEGNGDLTLTDMLLEHGADVNLGTKKWFSSVCNENQEFMLRYLVKNGVDLRLVGSWNGCTLLQHATEKGNRRIIDILLELGADINGLKGKNGFIIHYALMSGNESIVRHVLDEGAVINDSDMTLGSIVLAIRHKLTSLIPLLLEKGADLNSTSSVPSPAGEAFQKAPKEVLKMLMNRGAVFGNDFRILEHTIEQRPLEDLKELLEYGIDPNIPGDWRQAVTVAANKGLKDTIDLLIEYGADLNNIPQDTQNIIYPGFSARQGPLIVACRKGNLGIAQFLLERGADPNNDNNNFGSPLSWAVKSVGNYQLVELLFDYGAKIGLKQDIFSQAVSADEKMICRLLQQPMTSEDRERYLGDALQSAAYWTLLEMCVCLLNQGANPNHCGVNWGSSLVAAIVNIQIYKSADLNNRRLIIDLLLQHGADVNARPERSTNAMGEIVPTPLTAALQSTSMSIAKRILEAGADPNLPGGKLHLPLQTAARFCRPMTKPLLIAGAEVNAIGGATYGTALHAMAYAHDIEGIKLLLAHGADATIIAGKYGSVLQAAAKCETVERGSGAGRHSVPAMKLLMSAGADLHVCGGKYGSVLQMAAKSGNLKAVQWLVEEMGVDVNIKGGRFGSVRTAAVMKGRWSVVSYLEKKFGKFNWGGEMDQNDTRKGWVEE